MKVVYFTLESNTIGIGGYILGKSGVDIAKVVKGKQ